MSLSLRPAQPADCAEILRLIEALAEYEKLRDHCFATVESLSQHLFSPQPRAHVILAEWSGRVVGFALFFHTFSTFLARPGIYLEDLFVEPQHRGKGIGKALLIELARRAEAEGCGRLEWSVLNWNQPAIDFYESLGAKPLSDWTMYRLTADAISALARCNSLPPVV